MAIVGTTSHWLPQADSSEDVQLIRVHDLVDRAATLWPAAEAVVYSAYDDLGIRERWTFAELRQRSLACARAIVAAGIEPGERLGIWATNVPEWIPLQLGASYAGAIVVPINPLFRPDEVTHVLGQSGSAACFLLPENRGVRLWESLAGVLDRLPDLRLRVALGDAQPGGPSLAEWLAAGDGVDEGVVLARAKQVLPTDTSQIQYTSGTTGFPKGAQLSQLGIANNARLFAARSYFRAGGRHCNPMPFFHCGGCVMSLLGSISSGTCILPTLTFDARRVIDTVDGEQATSCSAVPTMMIAMEEELERGGGSLQSLDLIVTGGSPVPPDLARRWNERFRTRFTITYGLTEASPVISQSDPADPLELQVATCGQALPHVELDVVDVSTRQRVPIGEVGELRARGWLVMNGYWQNPEATAVAVEDGFLCTGDLATLDADGYVRIVGRHKDVIIRGGENIYAREVEQAILALPQVLDVVVVGIDDARYGEVPVAFVRLQPGGSLDYDQLVAELKPRLARFKIPARLAVVDAFPTTPSGKVQKFKLREIAAT